MCLIQLSCRCEEYEEGTTCGMCRADTISSKYIGVMRTDSHGSWYHFSPWGGMEIEYEGRLVGEIFKGNMSGGEYRVNEYDETAISKVDDWFKGVQCG